MSRVLCLACAASVACASWGAAACNSGGSGSGGGGEIACNDVVPDPAPTMGQSNCGLPPGELETIAQCCLTGLTADSGPPTYQAAIAETICGQTLDGDCGAYRRVFGPVTLGSAMIYYYDVFSGALVAVVQRADAFGDTCTAGPANFVEPCDQSCTPLGAATVPGCLDAGDAG